MEVSFYLVQCHCPDQRTWSDTYREAIAVSGYFKPILNIGLSVSVLLMEDQQRVLTLQRS